VLILYYITNRHGFPGAAREQRSSLLLRVAEAAKAGVDYIQLREKDLTPRELECLAKDAIDAVRAASNTTRVLINERTDIALACGADGVHLPANSLPASEVRSIWMRSAEGAPVIGVSAHSVDEVRYAEAHGADFVVLAPIFEKAGTELPGLGLDILSAALRRGATPNNTEAASQSSFPVLALGGLTREGARACLRAGAAGVAGIRLFQEGKVAETVRALREMN
jgi:thiamine-phosphate pyrophosphorylase